MHPGQKVCFLFASANRDELEFADPDRFDLLRRPRRSLAFGNGVHLCLGRHVARSEARIALEELLRRIPEYAVVESEAKRARTEYVQGWLRLPLEF
jgi:cytochrome P450